MDMFSFSGRANRMDFWIVSVGLSILQMLFSVLAGMMIGMLALSWLPEGNKAIAALIFALIVQLLFLWPITAVAVRRSHDRNMSGWWYGAYVIFGLALAVVAVILGAVGTLDDGVGVMIFDAIGLAHLGLGLLFLVILGILPGTRGANRFGPAPNSRQDNYRAPAID